MHLLAGVERVIVLAQGKIVMDGPAGEVITRLKPKRPAPQVIKTSVRAE
jgi:ABC-type glutathione transport system ATPase component